jgi:hypothetical protein
MVHDMRLRNVFLSVLFLGCATAAQAGGYSLETPISAIAADPKAAAVVDKNIPGLLSNSNFDIFKSLNLKQVSALSGGKLTKDMLNRTQTDFEALSRESGIQKVAY